MIEITIKIISLRTEWIMMLKSCLKVNRFLNLQTKLYVHDFPDKNVIRVWQYPSRVSQVGFWN